MEVEEIEPTSQPLKETLESMKNSGIHFLYGRWLVEGAPAVYFSIFHPLTIV